MSSPAAITPTLPRFEHHRPGCDSIGIGTAQPRISWSLISSQASTDWVPQEFSLFVQFESGETGTYSQRSSESRLIPWPWRPLHSRERAQVKVKVSGGPLGSWSTWSESAVVETGILQLDEWADCRLITPSSPYDNALQHVPITFKKSFELGPEALHELERARLYITAHGVYEATINGIRVGDHVLAPGWTSYNERLLYQTFDVTGHFHVAGSQLLEATVAEGWYCGRLGWNGGRRNNYGDSVGVLAVLSLHFRNGSHLFICTDDSWYWSYCNVLSSELYDGEVASLRPSEGPVTSFPVAVKTSFNIKTLSAPDGPPIRHIETLEAKNIFRSRAGKTIVDFGQNLVGRVRLQLSCSTVATIVLTHAEALEDGEIATRPLRNCKATDVLHVSPCHDIAWEAKFTYHGFRYVQVDGWPGRLCKSNIVATVLHTDMRRTGHFSCSNELLNRLHSNVVWSMRGNFVGLPTDCPQRDERFGWTADINLFSDTANFLFETAGLLQSWLRDVILEQRSNGGIVPLVVPNVISQWPGVVEAHAIWGDTVIMLPWSLYRAFGDISLLQHNFRSMQVWLEAIPRRCNGLWDYASDWKLGDWLDPSAPPDDPGNGATDPVFVSDCFLIHVTMLMESICEVLGKQVLLEQYRREVQRLKNAFQSEYVTPAGLVASDTQTAYALALSFDLLANKAQSARALERLTHNIRSRARFSVATGFAGTPYLGHALSQSKATNLFYRILMHRKCPSWLFPVTMGATTMWERWDSMLPNGRINPGEMTSFNHYAFGAVASWMHSNILGLKPKEPGWRVWACEPLPGGGLKWAEGSFESAYGLCSVKWTLEENDFTLSVGVPLNTTVYVRLPGDDELQVRGAGLHLWHKVIQVDPWPPRAIFPPNVPRDDELPPELVSLS